MANGKLFRQPVIAPTASRLPVKRLPSGGEIIDAAKGQFQPLYDNVFLAGGSGTNGEPLIFFTRGFGGGRGWEDTNVQTPGKLPGGVTFECNGFVVHLDSDNEADFRAYQRGLFTLYIGDSVYQRLPLHCLGGLGGTSNGPAATPMLNNGSFSTNDYYRLPKGFELPILSEQDFRVEITYRASQQPPNVASENGLRLWVFLIGDMTGLLDQS